MTSATPVQRSTNWANKPTGSWSVDWVAGISFVLTPKKLSLHFSRQGYFRKTLITWTPNEQVVLCGLCEKPVSPLLNYIFLLLVSKSIMRAIQLDKPNLTTKVEILSATLYKFFKIANFNVSPKHDDQEILLCITFFRNVPIHISWV